MRRLFVGAAAAALGLSPIASAAPADATIQVVGPATGTMTYDGDGIPPIDPLHPTDEPCRETTFDLVLHALVTVDVGDESYDGPVTITGSGRSGFSDDWRNCDSVWSWTGSNGAVVFSAEGTHNGVTLRCEEMRGFWLRFEATTWFADSAGPCSLGETTFSRGEVLVVVEWVPTPVGGGVTGNVTGAVLTGVVGVHGSP